MLEIPESHTLAKQLRETVLGRRILRAAANTSPHGFAFYNGDPGSYSALLEGLSVTGAQAYAGLAELEAENIRLMFGDGVNVRLLSAGTPRPAKHQLLLELDDGAALVCTVQMYGGMWAYPAGADDNFYHNAAREKPSPLTDAFDEAYFAGILSGAKPTMSAKALLATEQRIPGLGNGVLQDILYEAGVHPKTPLRAMNDETLAALYRSVKETLRQMTRLGGRDTEKDLFGSEGGYRTKLSKNTLAYPCMQCGNGLVRQAYLGGNIYFCPHCQPLRK